MVAGRWFTPAPYMIGELPAEIFLPEQQRNAAAVRVRARRRIRRSLGAVYGDELAPLLRAIVELETRRST